MLTEKDLLQKKQEIDKAKNKISELKGALNVLLDNLKEFECSTIEEAEKLLETLTIRQDKLKTVIQESTEELERNYFNNES